MTIKWAVVFSMVQKNGLSLSPFNYKNAWVFDTRKEGRQFLRNYKSPRDCHSKLVKIVI